MWQKFEQQKMNDKILMNKNSDVVGGGMGWKGGWMAICYQGAPGVPPVKNIIYWKVQRCPVWIVLLVIILGKCWLN